ncbi:hypothetical protein Aeq9CBH6_14890 [Adlercreutzia equolifaciens]|nr:hypothetical protein Aeq9CBH6_14890 [Adlercreutzia equolifaciens]
MLSWALAENRVQARGRTGQGAGCRAGGAGCSKQITPPFLAKIAIVSTEKGKRDDFAQEKEKSCASARADFENAKRLR